MALKDDQKAAVAEIIERPLLFVESVSLTEAQIERLSEDIDLWDANRNAVDLELKGEIDLRAQRLLDGIRERVRVMYGFPRYSEEINGSGSFALPTVPVF